MGMYTEIFINVDLKKEIPAEVINLLKEMCDMIEEDQLKEKPMRWSALFHSGSFYTPNTFCQNLTCDDEGRWSLLGKGDIKNYDNDIEKFFEFIKPWVDGYEGDFIGYTRYEESETPTLIFL